MHLFLIGTDHFDLLGPLAIQTSQYAYRHSCSLIIPHHRLADRNKWDDVIRTCTAELHLRPFIDCNLFIRFREAIYQ